MAGIRVDTEWLASYAKDVRAAGDQIVAARGDLEAGALRPEAFGTTNRSTAAADAYTRVADLLVGHLGRAGHLLVSAGDELRAVVDSHAGGDDEGAHGLTHKQGW